MHTRAQTPALLKGLIFGPTGVAMSPVHTRRCGKLYRYYVSTDVPKRDSATCPIRRVPAAEVERAVIDRLRGCCEHPKSSCGHGGRYARLGETFRKRRYGKRWRGSIRSGMSSSPPSWHASFSS